MSNAAANNPAGIMSSKPDTLRMPDNSSLTKNIDTNDTNASQNARVSVSAAEMTNNSCSFTMLVNLSDNTAVPTVLVHTDTSSLTTPSAELSTTVIRLSSDIGSSTPTK